MSAAYSGEVRCLPEEAFGADLFQALSEARSTIEWELNFKELLMQGKLDAKEREARNLSPAQKQELEKRRAGASSFDLDFGGEQAARAGPRGSRTGVGTVKRLGAGELSSPGASTGG